MGGLRWCWEIVKIVVWFDLVLYDGGVVVLVKWFGYDDILFDFGLIVGFSVLICFCSVLMWLIKFLLIVVNLVWKCLFNFCIWCWIFLMYLFLIVFV